MGIDVDIDLDIPTGDDITHAIEVGTEKVAQRGVNMVQAELGTVLRHPTGFYRSRIVTERRQDDWAVTDSGTVYGPWLETGASRRNTRFRGYTTFRRIGQRLDERSGDIVDNELERIF